MLAETTELADLQVFPWSASPLTDSNRRPPPYHGSGLRWRRSSARGLESLCGCKRSASIGLPPRCHHVPPQCTVAAENWLGAGVSAEHGGMRVHDRGGS
jgi:hypothetical protein